MPLSASGGVTGPATNLNIGMDYWGTAASPTVPVVRGKVPSTPVGGGMVPARDPVQAQLWIQVFLSHITLLLCLCLYLFSFLIIACTRVF